METETICFACYNARIAEIANKPGALASPAKSTAIAVTKGKKSPSPKVGRTGAAKVIHVRLDPGLLEKVLLSSFEGVSSSHHQQIKKSSGGTVCCS